MNQYVTGTTIKKLRIKKNLTQLELAQRLCVSDKTVSKWETGKGYPDISLLESLAKELGVSVAELLSGEMVKNTNVSANILKSKFYVCPICGNIMHTMGETSLSCHGINLQPLSPEESDENHMILIERVEDEYFVQINHEMKKSHYISFVATMSFDKLELIKLYPESSAEVRFPIRGVKRIYYYCNRDGLFYIDPVKGIDDRSYTYEDIEEMKVAEEIASILFK